MGAGLVVLFVVGVCIAMYKTGSLNKFRLYNDEIKKERRTYRETVRKSQMLMATRAQKKQTLESRSAEGGVVSFAASAARNRHVSHVQLLENNQGYQMKTAKKSQKCTKEP